MVRPTKLCAMLLSYVYILAVFLGGEILLFWGIYGNQSDVTEVKY